MLDSPNSFGRDSLAMIVQVARMYHEQGMSQPAIAERLRLSQSRVSRWLKQAAEAGIVRTVVIPPDGVHSDVEEQLTAEYGLRQALIVQAPESEDLLMAALGGVAASYLEKTLEKGARVGFSSWSETPLATVNSMMPLKRRHVDSIVQIMGGIGNPDVQFKATQLTDRFARLTGAKTTLLPTPGIVSSGSVQQALLQDAHVRQAHYEWDRLTDVVVGVGSLKPSRLLRGSGNALSDMDLQVLSQYGAVGDVAMRFFDSAGRYVESELDDRIVGIGVEQLLRIPRRIGVAGGERKVEALAAAMRGGWIDVLITDLRAARQLVGFTHRKAV